MPPRKAAKNASAAAAVEGRDHISNLPDGVLQHMLSFLPAQDVVQTCVLAKRWRHLWKSTPVLRFLCGGHGPKEPYSVAEIQEFVDQLLRLRIRAETPLDTCEFRTGDCQWQEFDMSRMIHWIRIALQCKVRVLRLVFWGQEIDRQDDHPFFISGYLKKLELQGLPVMPTRKFLDFSCCPNLEDLVISGCTLEDAFLISSQSLRRLTIDRCYFDYCRRMPICAPNLVSLSLSLDVEDNDGIPWLESMPSLLTAYVDIYGDVVDRSSDSDGDHGEGNDNRSILLQGLSEVRNLVLISHNTEMFVFRRELKFCSSFNKLKSLLVNEYWCQPSGFSALVCLLKLSPVLEKLTLQLHSEGPKHKVEIKLSCKPLEMSAAISQHFKTLEVKCKEYDERVNNVLTFLSKQLNIWFQFSG